MIWRGLIKEFYFVTLVRKSFYFVFSFAVVIDFTSKNRMVEHFRSSALYLVSSI